MSDEWEAIRSLDDKENWIERTSVLSKDDHQHLLLCAEEILNDVLDTLPIESKKEPSDDVIEQQFTDEDFQYSAAQFDVDYLEHIVTDRSEPSELTRQSLYVKFDPLVGTNSPKVNKILPNFSDDLLILNTPPASGIKSCLSTNKGGTSGKKQVQIGSTEAFLENPLISTETSMTPQGPANRSTLLIDSSPKLISTPDTQQQGSFTDGQDAPPPSQHHVTPPTDTLIKVLKYSENDLTGMKEEAIDQAREEAKKEKDEEMASLRKEIAALKREAKKLQQKDNTQKIIVSSHQTVVTKLEAEIQQHRERVEAHEERENDVLEHHQNFLKDINLVKERSNLIREDMNHLENFFEETHKCYLALKNTHKNLGQQTELLEQRKTQLQQCNEQGAALVKRLKEESKIQAEEIESTLEQTRKELAAKRSLEKAKQDQLQMQVDSLEKSIEQLEQEKKQLSSMCEELMKAM
ncbi:transforming acidic coiled-coil-containing protein 3-like isoform X2 [Halichondria panicea]|uniref:transforming acidic coiled-coil-containing protein 3-like isoform X2 n=1 Tax=Halichondria panicea TaxID=6063 RepID=UPI00312B484B